MTERERLVELLKLADENAQMKLITGYSEVIEDNADYLLENGVIVPPCKVGEDIYNVLPYGFFKGRIFKEKVKGFAISIITDKSIFPIRMIGDDVFLTREEAEQALKGGGEE